MIFFKVGLPYRVPYRVQARYFFKKVPVLSTAVLFYANTGTEYRGTF